jgi:hypothetical protein
MSQLTNEPMRQMPRESQAGRMTKMRNLVILLIILIALAANTASAATPGTNEDPFGGLPVRETEFGTLLPGGVPSALSGDGSTPRKAIYIADDCATLRFQAGKARWFKLDAWGDKQQTLWLDDELASATQPSGSAVWGAAHNYMVGTAPGDGWRVNAYLQADAANENLRHGYVMAVYDPDSLRPLNYFSPPNAAILSVNTDARGFLLNGPTNLSIADTSGARIHGLGAFNRAQPSHLLWYEARFTGWVFVLVYNQMIWDDTASVCAARK